MKNPIIDSRYFLSARLPRHSRARVSHRFLFVVTSGLAGIFAMGALGGVSFAQGQFPPPPPPETPRQQPAPRPYPQQSYPQTPAYPQQFPVQGSQSAVPPSAWRLRAWTTITRWRPVSDHDRAASERCHRIRGGRLLGGHGESEDDYGFGVRLGGFVGWRLSTRFAIGAQLALSSTSASGDGSEFIDGRVGGFELWVAAPVYLKTPFDGQGVSFFVVPKLGLDVRAAEYTSDSPIRFIGGPRVESAAEGRVGFGIDVGGVKSFGGMDIGGFAFIHAMNPTSLCARAGGEDECVDAGEVDLPVSYLIGLSSLLVF